MEFIHDLLNGEIERKKTEIKGYYDNLSLTFSYEGNIYQTDREAEINLTAFLLMVELQSLPIITWRTLDNRMIDFTREEFKEFCNKVFNFKQGNFIRKVHHIDTVKSLKTIEEVVNYDFLT